MNSSFLRAFFSAAISFIGVPLLLSTEPVVPTAQANPNLSIFVDLSDRKAYLFQGETLVARYPVAIGRPGWETPVGNFQITDMQTNPAWLSPHTGRRVPPSPNSPIGDRWIEFASKGEFKVGFHGTNQPNSVGLAASDGCLRMRRNDIHELYSTVYIGTPVIVRH